MVKVTEQYLKTFNFAQKLVLARLKELPTNYSLKRYILIYVEKLITTIQVEGMIYKFLNIHR